MQLLIILLHFFQLINNFYSSFQISKCGTTALFVTIINIYRYRLMLIVKVFMWLVVSTDHSQVSSIAGFMKPQRFRVSTM